MPAPLITSHARGAVDVPLIEQTIGAFFDDMVARQPEHKVWSACTRGDATATGPCAKRRAAWPAPCWP